MRKPRRSLPKRKSKEIAALPSGHVGVYRAGSQWEAYVMKDNLVRLGTYATKRAAVAARAKYWKAQ
jgi:hypothetical protein